MAANAAAVAKEIPFSLTPVRDVAGGGCVGETRIFAEVATTKDLEDRALNPESALLKSGTWKLRSGRLVDGSSFVVTTVGCGAETIAVGIDGKSYQLDQIRYGELGEPVRYLKMDDPTGPKVKVEAKEVLRDLFVKETDCRVKYRRVRFSVEFKGATAVFDGTSVNGCP